MRIRLEELTAEDDESGVFLEVRDTGVGISEEGIERLFTRFTQLHPKIENSRTGTGLGLAISRGFVELHGGRLEVVSEVGKGSTFTVFLPSMQENWSS